MERRTPEPTLWKTQQVAELLGLSPSTVKRLVNSRKIRAARTDGGHRLIAKEEAIRYGRERGLLGPEAEPRAVATSGLVAEGGPPTTPEMLVAALRRGRAEEARSLIVSAHGAVGAVGLADGLIRPALEGIGHDWETGALDVFQEHRATRIVESALIELLGGLRRPAPRHAAEAPPLALGAGPEGDPYTVAGLLCELALRERGWETMNLGPNLPMASLAKAVLAHQPRLVWISVSYLADPGRFVREYASFYRAASATGAAVILGGQALGPDLRAQLVSAGFGERVAHLVELARMLHPLAPGRPARDGESTDPRISTDESRP